MSKKPQSLYNFGLVGGTYGIATMPEIEEMCSDFNTTIYNLSQCSYEDVQDWICEGWDVDPGCYQIEDGVIEVCDETEDWDIILISNNLRVIK